MFSKSSGLFWFVLVLWDPEKWPKKFRTAFPQELSQAQGSQQRLVCFNLNILFYFILRAPFAATWRSCCSSSELDPNSAGNGSTVQAFPSTVQTEKMCNPRAATPAFFLPLYQLYPGTATAKSYGIESIFSLIFKELSSAAPFPLLTLHSPSPPHPERCQRQEWQGQQCSFSNIHQALKIKDNSCYLHPIKIIYTASFSPLSRHVVLRAPSSCTCTIPTPITFPTNSWKEDFSSPSPDVKSLSVHFCKALGFQTGSTLTARAGGRCQWEIKDGIPWTGKIKSTHHFFCKKLQIVPHCLPGEMAQARRVFGTYPWEHLRKKEINNKGMNNKGITLPEKEIFRGSSIL